MIQNQKEKNNLSSSVLLFTNLIQNILALSLVLLSIYERNIGTTIHYANKNYVNSVLQLMNCEQVSYNDFKYIYISSQLFFGNIFVWAGFLIKIGCFFTCVIFFKKYFLKSIKHKQINKLKTTFSRLEILTIFLYSIPFRYFYSFYSEFNTHKCIYDEILNYRQSFLKYSMLTGVIIGLGIVSLIVCNLIVDQQQQPQIKGNKISEEKKIRHISKNQVADISPLQTNRPLFDERAFQQKIKMLEKMEAFSNKNQDIQENRISTAQSNKIQNLSQSKQIPQNNNFKTKLQPDVKEISLKENSQVSEQFKKVSKYPIIDQKSDSFIMQQKQDVKISQLEDIDDQQNFTFEQQSNSQNNQNQQQKNNDKKKQLETKPQPPNSPMKQKLFVSESFCQQQQTNKNEILPNENKISLNQILNEKLDQLQEIKKADSQIFQYNQKKIHSLNQNLRSQDNQKKQQDLNDTFTVEQKNISPTIIKQGQPRSKLKKNKKITFLL